jgi:hypothetical protein
VLQILQTSAVAPNALVRARARLASAFSLGWLGRRHRLRAERRAADEELMESRWVSPLLAWRANELVARSNRVDLARSLRRMIRDADARYLPNASPVNRVAVRAESNRLLAIARRLESDDPVAPRGVLLADRLLVDGLGPLYSRARVDELPSYLDVTLEALEP